VNASSSSGPSGAQKLVTQLPIGGALAFEAFTFEADVFPLLDGDCLD